MSTTIRDVVENREVANSPYNLAAGSEPGEYYIQQCNVLAPENFIVGLSYLVTDDSGSKSMRLTNLPGAGMMTAVVLLND